LHRNLSGETVPSETGDPVVAIDISASFNMPLRESTFGVDLGDMQSGRIAAGSGLFDLTPPSASAGKGIVMVGTVGKTPNPLPREVRSIPIGKDASSLLSCTPAPFLPPTRKLTA